MRMQTTCCETTSFLVMRIQATKCSATLAMRLGMLPMKPQAAMMTAMMTPIMPGLHSAEMRREEGVAADRLAKAPVLETHRNR